jgi:hypothetical protein
LLQLALACGAVVHAVVHAPQWLGSVFEFTQAPAQFWVPVGQFEVHLPCVQTSLFFWSQIFPQAPQFCGSLSVFTHALQTFESSPGHGLSHWA